MMPEGGCTCRACVQGEWVKLSSLASFLRASADVDEVGLEGGDLLTDDAELVGARYLKLHASALSADVF